MKENIRKATAEDICRISEIEIFNYRLYFYPVFRSDWFYFTELQVDNFARRYREDPELIENSYVYDDGAVKGFMRVGPAEVLDVSRELQKLFVEPVLHNQGIGSCLLEYAIESCGCTYLWPLELNRRAISLYERHSFVMTSEKRPEEGTSEYLVKMVHR